MNNSNENKESTEKKYDNRQFINELIYENIDLVAEKIKLICENRKLQERVKELEKDKSDDLEGAFTKGETGCRVIIIVK